MEKQEQLLPNPRRNVLQMAVAGILDELGFAKADKQCVESLTEMLQSLIVEIANTSKNYAELSGRTQPFLGDIVVALTNLGIPLNGITAFVKKDIHKIPPPQPISTQKQLSLLQAGTKQSHPPHIPNHLPPLPDPHAYVRTPTHKQPVTEYEAIREKAASQKRDIEKALTRFLAKTSETDCLFASEDNQMFPLIACKPSFPPYLAALNPTDQVFDFEELEYHYLVANRTEDMIAKDDDDEDEDGDEKDKDDKNRSIDEHQSSPIDSISTSPQLKSPNIDNPYLKAAKPSKRAKSDLQLSTIDVAFALNLLSKFNLFWSFVNEPFDLECEAAKLTQSTTDIVEKRHKFNENATTVFDS